MTTGRRVRRAAIWAAALALLAGLAAFGLRYRDYAFSAAGLDPSGGAGAAALGLKLVAEVPLTGSTSRFDYQVIDPDRGLLFIAHLGADRVTVFDLARQQVTADIPGIAGAHGLTLQPGAGRLFASATGSGQVAAIDEATLQVTGRADGGQYPDGLAYDPDSGRLFISDETGGADIVVDAVSMRRIGRIDLGGQAGNTQYDPVGRQIVAAAEGAGQLVIIDPAAQAVTRRLDLPGCQGPHGFYLDAPARRAFVSCEGNASLLAVDLASGRVTATSTVGDGPDVLAFDPGLQRLYVAAESGVVAVFDTRAGGLSKIGQAFLAPAAHSVAVDAGTHRVYVPLENVDGRPVLRIYQPDGS